MMESRLKELLRDRADEVRVDPAIPAEVVRRARSRRRSNVGLAALLAVAVVAGSVVGVRAILDAESPRRPAATGWPGIWPQDTRAQAEVAQELVDERAEDPPQGVGAFREGLRDEIVWQLDAGEVATRFAVERLGWQFASVLEPLELLPDTPGPVVVPVESCSEMSFCDPQFTADVTVERLLRPDRFGLWFVTGVDQAISPAAAEELLLRFLDARLDEASVDDLIAPAAREIYAAGEDGLSLYGGAAGPFTGYAVQEEDQAGEDTFLFVVSVHRVDGTVAESILIGPGIDTVGDPKPVLVLSVSRVEYREIGETPPPPPTPPPAEESPSTQEEVFELVTHFMDARLAGSGAEDYLGTEARLAYEEHEALWQEEEPGLYLYGNQHPGGGPSANFVRYRIEDVRPTDAETCAWFPEAACQDAWEVVVAMDLEPVGEGQPATMRETLIVAPADGAAAEFADWMIAAAARGQEPTPQGP